jgi:glutamyl-tRNA reductase
MQKFAILSVNHQLAPVEVREKVAFTSKEIPQSLENLKSEDGIKACSILSTCNRSELYVVSENESTKETLGAFLAKTHQIDYSELKPYLSYFEGDDAVNKICEVATGLDSMVMGEPQILGQIKDAYHIAKDAGTLNKHLEKLFQHAFSTAKKVRTDTEIGSSPISVAYCAVKLSERIFADLSEQTALLVGAGEMIDLCTRHLNEKGIKKIIIANRTIENAKKIAKDFGATGISLKNLSDYIPQADILISSTAASLPIIGKGMIESALKIRKHKPMFMVDIAIPRDIESEVNELKDVFLYTLDDLQDVVKENIHTREQEKNIAIEIIHEENTKFSHWLETQPNEMVVQDFTISAHSLKSSIVSKAIDDLNKGQDPEKIIKRLGDQLTNKLLHSSVQNIKKVDQTQLENCVNCVPKNKK